MVAVPNIDIIALEGYVNTGWFEDEREMPAALTDVFVRHANCAPESVHLRFHPVREKNYAVGGRLATDSKKTIFEVRVGWYARPREVQNRVTEALKETVHGLTGLPKDNVEAYFTVLEP